MSVRSGETTLAHIEPAKRFYRARKMQRSEAGIVTLGLGQIYAAIGDSHPDGTIDEFAHRQSHIRLASDDVFMIGT